MIHTQKVLEFSRIKNSLKRYSFFSIGSERIDKMKPFSFLELQKELECLSDFIQEQNFREFPSVRLPELRPYLKTASREDSVLIPVDFLKIAEFLQEAITIDNYLKQSDAESLRLLSEQFTIPEQLAGRISEVMDKEGEIKDSASPVLSKIRKESRDLRLSIESRIQKILDNPSHALAIQDKLITVKDNRWVIPIKKDFKGKVRGLVISSSASGETLFIEPEAVVEDNNRYTELMGEEKSEILRILKRLTNSLRNTLGEWETLLPALAEVDFLQCRAKYAKELEASRPYINRDMVLDLKQARHPLLEKPCPIDVELGQNFKILIITGPNTGGKTVALKTAGLLTLMANCGLFVPAREGSLVPLVDEIYVDIGDEQSIIQSLSTFSAHIENIKTILHQVSPSSLVLIDELGAGTDPRDGSALAVAITEELLRKGPLCILTSHLEKVKNMAFHHKDIENASVEFSLKTLSPRYRLRIGVTGKSYGLEIARRLGISSSIVERAKEIAQPGQKDYDMEQILNKLNREIRAYQDRKQRYDNLSFHLNKKRDELYNRERELQKIENSLRKKEGGAVLEQIKDIRKQLISLIRDAKSRQDLKHLKDQARKLEKLAFNAREAASPKAVKKEKYQKQTPEKRPVELEELKEGDTVRIIKFDKEATVVSVNVDKKILTANMGAIKIKLKANEVEAVAENDKQKPKTQVEFAVNTKTKTSLEINIIGMRREEGLREAESYVHSLSLTSGSEGRIIHGRGTGILKQAVNDYLKGSPLIKEFNVSADGGSTYFKLL